MTSRDIKINFIIETVANYYSMVTDDLMIKTRRTEYIKPRYISIYFSKKITQTSYENLATYYPVYTVTSCHAKIRHAYNSIQGRIDIYKSFQNEMDEVSKYIKDQWKKRSDEIKKDAEIKRMEQEESDMDKEVFTFQLNDFYKN